MHCLVAYHSLSGNTRKVAERAAKHIGADIAEVRTARYRPGVFGFLRAAYDSWAGRLPPIDVGGESPETYDFVLVMAPIWVGHASTPIRSYLRQNQGRFRNAAFLLTCGNSVPPRAFKEMSSLFPASNPRQCFLCVSVTSRLEPSCRRQLRRSSPPSN